MKILRSVLVALLLLNLSGCAGVLVAGAATGVAVVTDPRSTREILKDNEISLNATAFGNKAPFQFNARVSANTFRGEVLLMGQAVSQSYKDQLTEKVRRINGVKAVYNEMRVRPLLNVGDISKDTWITTKVKSALVANEQLRMVKVTVYTEDGEVFLVGALSRANGELAIDIARNISGVRQVITSFYYGELPAVAEKEPESKPAPTKALSHSSVAASEPVSNQEQVASTETIPYIEPIEEPLGEDDL